MTDPGTGPRRGAVVLTGGTAARMGGADKATIELAGATLLERAIAATAGAVEVVLVGEPGPTSRPVTWTREDPAGGGPAAGLLAALDSFLRPPDLLVVLAVDMPCVTPETFARLEAAVTPAHDGAILVDPGGRRQPLCAVYRRTALDRARPADREDEHGLPMHRLTAAMRLAEVPADLDEAVDVDTWGDLRALEARAAPPARRPRQP
jgi:molybdopterin-guanine dinucleotide biosynthesis protein A